MFDLATILQNKEQAEEYKLLDSDYKYFDDLIVSLSMNKSNILYNGIVKKLYNNNAYTTIRNDDTWTVKKKILWEKYINEKFETANDFNKYCRDYRLEFTKEIAPFTICGNPANNLVFIKNGKKLDCYAFKYKNKNKEIELVSSMSTNTLNFENDIINYLRYHLHIPELAYLSNYKIASILKGELTLGKMIAPDINTNDILKISNNYYTYCLAYFKLPKPKKQKSRTTSIMELIYRTIC